MQTKLLIIGLMASFLSSLSDILLLYEPNARYHLFDYEFLNRIPADRIFWGHYLGTLTIPLELTGIWAVLMCVKRDAWRIGLFLMMAWLMCCSVAYHTGILWLTDWLKEHPGQDIGHVRSFFEPLGYLLAIGFFVLSAVLVWGYRSGWVNLPRIAIALNPVSVYLLLLLLYFLVPVIGRMLIVAGFNLSLGLFFLTFLCTKEPDTGQIGRSVL
jgi:hypothetical protein